MSRNGDISKFVFSAPIIVLRKPKCMPASAQRFTDSHICSLFIFQVISVLVIVAVAQHCNGDLSCKGKCELVYGDACIKECEFVLSETSEDMDKCREKCRLERVDCIDECKPWWWKSWSGDWW